MLSISFCAIHFLKINHQEDCMGYKKMKHNLGFADLALSSSVKHNRSLKLMETLDAAIDWSLCMPY